MYMYSRVKNCYSYCIYYKGSVLFLTGEVTDLSFDLTNKYLVCSGDKHVSVFNNITGYRASIDDLQEKLKSGNTQAQKERIRQQITEAQSVFI